MKPSKKKNLKCQKPTERTTPTIDSYFKAAAKQLNLDVDTTTCDPSNEKAIYIEALKKKLQDLDGDGAQAGDIDIAFYEEDAAVGTEIVDNEGAVGGNEIFEQEDVFGTSKPAAEGTEPAKCPKCVEWNTKYDDLKKLCLKLTIRNASMDLKYDDLLKTKTYVRQLVPDDGASASSTDDFFTPKELKFLEVLSLEKKTDSTFVRHCLEFIYKDHLAALSTKTLKGTAEKQHFSDEGVVERVTEGKDPLTPPKVARIRSLFVKRISKAGVGPVEYGERIKDTYLNRLIAASIQNISKKC